ncbi:MAG: carbohydrate binding family 9 domain-containing protein [Candidatus Zixiibacteriota bacterium]|nr:MAG: carbohydrate binding family 9 domain-containing protein [candidate division Zixibacteria bacterium]
MQKQLLFLLILFFTWSLVIAESKLTGEEAVATKISESIKIDGMLSEEAWMKGKSVTGFIQYTPNEGKPASEPTKVTVLYDETAIYVGFMCYESEPKKMVMILGERDSGIAADRVQLEIDSFHDHMSSFFFEVNASGTMRDSYRFGVGDNYDITWDSVWEVKTHLGPEGWSAEFRIPYHCLRFNEAEENVWGVNFYRHIMSKNEYVIWHYNTETHADDISAFRHLVNLKGIKPARHFEILPYFVSSQHNDPGAVNRKDGLDLNSDIGIDLKYGITPSMTFDASINPDFGQVESDPAVINLSTFETFYEEKRPFFIEGANKFNTDYRLFYSRRIGRAPSASPDDLDYWLKHPDRTTILGAAKLTGKTSNGWELGLLNAVTEREYASYITTDGEQIRAVVMDEANYNIARVKKEFDSGSSIGILTTTHHQKGSTPTYTGGMDWELLIRGREYSFSGQTVGSRLGGGESGIGIGAEFSKNSGKHIRGTFAVEYKSRDLDLNKTGYLSRPNWLGSWGWLQYRIAEPVWILQQGFHNINYWEGQNLDGDLISLGGNYNNGFQFVNLWTAGLGIAVDLPHYDDRETRGGPLVKIPQTWSFWIWGESNNSKPFMVNVNPSIGTVRDGSWADFYLSFKLRPRENLTFSIGPGIETMDNVSRWLTDTENESGERVDIFGELDYREVNMNLRSTMTFRRNMTLILYSQFFIGAGDYSNIKQFIPFDEFTELTVDYDENPDFNYKSFKLNAVFRWEYMPGSDLYIVWTQARDRSDESGDFGFDRDFNDMFNTASDNVFLAKINYWWNP